MTFLGKACDINDTIKKELKLKSVPAYKGAIHKRRRSILGGWEGVSNFNVARYRGEGVSNFNFARYKKVGVRLIRIEILT